MATRRGYDKARTSGAKHDGVPIKAATCIIVDFCARGAQRATPIRLAPPRPGTANRWRKRTICTRGNNAGDLPAPENALSCYYLTAASAWA